MPQTAAIFRELRPTLALAFPIIVGQVGQMMMGITDSVMIGQVGKVPLAASAFANGVCNLIFIVGMGLLLPVAVLAARAHGAKESRECAEYLRHGMATAVAIGGGTLLILGFLSSQLHHFGQPAEVVGEVNPYFLLLTASLIPAFLHQVLKQFSEAIGHPWAAMNILLGCVGLNVFLNWVLIYGNLGAPALGLAGAGWATLAARTTAVALLWWWLARQPAVRKEWPERWRRTLSWTRLREMMRIGIPVGSQWLFEAGAFSAAAFMMGWIGTVPLAAHQIALSCAAFTFMFPLGLSAAVSVRLSKSLGAGRLDVLRPIGFGALAAGLVVMSCFGLIFAFGGGLLARGFTPEADVVALATKLLVVAAVFQIFDGAQVIGAGALRGLTDVKIPTLITFIAYWIFALPAGYLLAFKTPVGAVGVWMGLAAGLGSAAVFLAWRFHHKTRPGSL
ncbi:MAG: MATE family efflux transporter [Candidatus Didemnitutus sp.]|nr:MATE family efflux transporter [Candidatus Didemnitutus sp.]